METSTEEVTYEYDSRGNQVEEENTTTEETTETTYNVAGEMVQLVKKNGETTAFTQNNVYNQDGSRISRTQGDVEREYYYHSGVVAFTEDNNVLSASNLQNETGSVFGIYRGEAYYNYLKNLQGSTMSITGENGQAAAVYSYSDFGETEEVVADSIGNEICYTGAVYDKDTGLYYMNARYYDAVTGRFISQDSYRGEIEDAGTWHLYAYCSNDPVNNVDPSGHAWKKYESIEKENSKKAKKAKKKYEKNCGKYTFSSYIDNQEELTKLVFKNTTIAEQGCGIIATYNYLKTRGITRDFLQLICEFEYNMDKIWHKLPGIAPATVKKAIKAYVPIKKVNDFIVFKNGMNTKKKGVLLYKYKKGAHYVVFKKNSQDYRVYNGTPNKVETIDGFMAGGNKRRYWTGFYKK